ncbi:MAG: hypothetical protein U9Q66_00240, partial [Patescibacteria group bacterium]|nr:hypothetical protein [Patescibacteria group bacterium]
ILHNIKYYLCLVMILILKMIFMKKTLIILLFTFLLNSCSDKEDDSLVEVNDTKSEFTCDKDYLVTSDS